MRSRTAIWFECKIRYEKVMGDGLQKKVTEQYVVNAMSFTEAEAKVMHVMSQYISGEYEVTDIKKAPYKEVFFMGFAEKVLGNDVEDLSKAIRKKDRAAYDKWEGESLEEKFEKAEDSRWYKAKLQFITIDEKTEKVKRSNVTYLVEACSLHNALDNIDTVMKGTMIDYVQANVGETQIIDVLEFVPKKEADDGQE